MAGKSRAISDDAVAADLDQVRLKGAGRLRTLPAPALSEIAALRDGDGSDTAAAIRSLLHDAVETLGGGSLQEAAEYLLGLYPGTSLWSSRQRRDSAAEAFGLASESFRKTPMRELLGQTAEAVLVLAHEAQIRKARVDLEARRHPADSRLAVQWVERFEAYYRIWTPAWALAEDLESALETYLEEPSAHLPWDPDSAEPYDPIRQARGYGHSSLYWLTSFWLEVRRFRSKHGGLWLLSDAEVEQEVADTVYSIGWHNPLSDADESFLRRLLADSRHEEAQHFWRILEALPDGRRIDELWQNMIRQGIGLTADEEKAKSQVWLTIAACRTYCRLIDEDWLKIADWYRPGSTPRRGITGKDLYNNLVGED